MERLLSLVPSQTEPDKSMMDTIRTFEKFERPPPQDFALTRALKQGGLGPEVVYTEGIQIGVKNRMGLMKMMLESETTIGSKTIEDMLDKSFFETNFWMLWATA
jgi:oleate hydratase